MSAAGHQEAHGLLTQLRDYRIGRILSGPALRCQQTVQPLAERRGLRVETAQALGVEADAAGLVALLLDPAATGTVLCSHGELIGEALARLLGHDVNGESLVWPKGSTWAREVQDGQVQDRHYLAPLRLHDVKAGYYWGLIRPRPWVDSPLVSAARRCRRGRRRPRGRCGGW